MKELFNRYFWKYGQRFCERLSRIIGGLARSCKASTGLIAQAIATQDKINFESAWMFVHRLLRDPNFQIDDSFWRCHGNMIFDCLREKHGLKNGDNIQVNVDYTTLNDDFLILCASINVAGEKDVMLYFTARNYPKRKNQMDQKKMELAFFKGLRHVLSKKYTYTIVADRRFANSRLLQILEDLKFDYVLRIKENLIVEKEQGNRENLQNYAGQNASFWAEVVCWEKVVKIVVKTTNNDTWYLITNRDDVDIADSYAKRFKIEKLFQDLKSSAFDIEKTKIRKYDRVKRLLYLSAVCHALMVFFGHFIKFAKKNFPNHWDIVIAFSNSEWPPYYSVLDQSTEISSSI